MTISRFIEVIIYSVAITVIIDLYSWLLNYPLLEWQLNTVAFITCFLGVIFATGHVE